MSRKRKKREQAQTVKPGGTENHFTADQLKGKYFHFFTAGKQYFAKGKFREAIAEWNKIATQPKPVELVPLLAEAHFRLGIGYYRDPNVAQKYNLIVAELSRAISLEDKRAIYYFHLGLAYEHLGNAKKARNAYRKAVELEPGEQRYGFHLALAYLKSDHTQNLSEFTETGEQTFLSRVLFVLNKLKTGNGQNPFEILPEEMRQTKAGQFFTGLLFLKNGSTEEAKKWFDKSYRSIKGDDGSGLSSLLDYFSGLIHLKKNELNLCDQYWLRAFKKGFTIERYSRNLIILFWQKGLAYARKKDWERSKEWFRAILSIQPDHQATLSNLERVCFLQANDLAQKNRWEEALDMWQLSCAKDDLNAFHNVAIAYDKLSDAKRANIYWNKVCQYHENELRKHPDDKARIEYLTVSYQHLIKNYEDSNDSGRSLTVLQKLAALKPEDSKIQIQLAETFMDLRKLGAARRLLENILLKEPENIKAMLDLAFIHEMEWNETKAIETLNKVLEIEPDNVGAKKQLASVINESAYFQWTEVGNIEKAVQLYKQQIELDPANFDGYFELGQLYSEEYDDRKATRSLFMDYVQTDPDNPVVYMKVSQALIELEYPGEANSFLNKAEKLAKNDPMLLIELGKLLYEKSRRKAKSYFKKALAIEPQNAACYYEIAKKYISDDLPAAEKYFKECIKLEPNHLLAHIDLSFVYLLQNKMKKSQEHKLTAKFLAEKAGKSDQFEDIWNMQNKMRRQLEDINELQFFGDD